SGLHERHARPLAGDRPAETAAGRVARGRGRHRGGYGGRHPNRDPSSERGGAVTVLGESAERFDVPVPGHPDAGVTLSWGLATDVGYSRAHNEDSIAAVPPVFAVA